MGVVLTVLIVWFAVACVTAPLVGMFIGGGRTGSGTTQPVAPMVATSARTTRYQYLGATVLEVRDHGPWVIASVLPAATIDSSGRVQRGLALDVVHVEIGGPSTRAKMAEVLRSAEAALAGVDIVVDVVDNGERTTTTVTVTSTGNPIPVAVAVDVTPTSR